LAASIVRREKSISSVGRATLDAAQARARVNRFLLSQVGSQFCAGDPELDVQRESWSIPILLVTPGFVAGPVGEASINLNTGELESHSSMESIYLAAEELRKRHHAAIKAAFLRTRKG
jgi:hypothetical protein